MNPKGASNMGCGASSTAATTRNTLLFVSGQRYGQQQGKSLQTLSKPQRKDAPSARAQKKEQSNSEVLTSTMEQQQRVVSFPLYNTLSTQEDLKIDSFGSALLATGLKSISFTSSHTHCLSMLEVFIVFRHRTRNRIK